MRYPPGHKEKTRNSILHAAASAFRELGYHAAGVDEIMKRAGLTAGGFYSHFKNKEDLLAQMVEAWPQVLLEQMPEEIKRKSGTAWVIAMGEWYLSSGNRDDMDRCCPLPSLISELCRQGEAAREAYAKTHKVMEELLVSHLEEFPSRRRRAIARNLMMITMGTMTSARAMGETAMSDQYLAAGRKATRELLERERAALEVA